ncbi:hypothetical protein EDF36_0804 [Rathayibacter sp. PhB152]|nr:hypothetical protein EDF36_0804 [Rathayibacter sp. PhB152]
MLMKISRPPSILARFIGAAVRIPKESAAQRSTPQQSHRRAPAAAFSFSRKNSSSSRCEACGVKPARRDGFCDDACARTNYLYV